MILTETVYKTDTNISLCEKFKKELNLDDANKFYPNSYLKFQLDEDLVQLELKNLEVSLKNLFIKYNLGDLLEVYSKQEILDKYLEKDTKNKRKNLDIEEVLFLEDSLKYWNFLRKVVKNKKYDKTFKINKFTELIKKLDIKYKDMFTIKFDILFSSKEDTDILVKFKNYLNNLQVRFDLVTEMKTYSDKGIEVTYYVPKDYFKVISKYILKERAFESIIYNHKFNAVPYIVINYCEYDFENALLNHKIISNFSLMEEGYLNGTDTKRN